MKRVYVAGAYSADNVIDVLKNIGRGEHYSALLFEAGFAPFVPWHDKDFVLRLWDKNLNVGQFYEYGMAWLEVSDCIFLVPGWQNSVGTLAELKRAGELGIPVYDDMRVIKEKEQTP